ncbi:MAG: hypothetical protein GY729_15655 [Desulfobacteraceae bacterium]|nr:hypothetical protein [Desulfobacteraceae bacterium]
MMTLKEIEFSSATFATLYGADIPIRQIVDGMAKRQRKYADEWTQIAKAVNHGEPLSDHLKDLWPESLVQAVKAGEVSGDFGKTFLHIESLMHMFLEAKQKTKRLYYPALIVGAGIVTFIFVMAYVMPVVRDVIGLQTKDTDGMSRMIFSLSDQIAHIFVGNVYFYSVAALGTAIITYALIKNPGTKTWLFNVSLSIPYVKTHLKSIYFGVWAYYVSLLSAAGIERIGQTLKLPIASLPERYHESVDIVVEVAKRKGIKASVDVQKMNSGDPRLEWPEFIINAFEMAYDTGRLDKQMRKASKALMAEGFWGLDLFIGRLITASTIFAAAVVGIPVFCYFAQMGYAVQKLSTYL